MIRKKGITGFRDVRSPEQSEISLKEIKRLCNYHVRNMQINRIFSPKNANYFCIETENQSHEILYILANKYYNIASVTADLCVDKRFEDMAEANEILYNYSFIPSEKLNSAFDLSESDLYECEYEQIFHHKPVSVGNIIFNEWD